MRIEEREGGREAAGSAIFRRSATTNQGARLSGPRFSAGGILRATLNLGILQGWQEAGLLMPEDDLSPVSEGGHIGICTRNTLRMQLTVLSALFFVISFRLVGHAVFQWLIRDGGLTGRPPDYLGWGMFCTQIGCLRGPRWPWSGGSRMSPGKRRDTARIIAAGWNHSFRGVAK